MPILIVLLEAWIATLGIWVVCFAAALYWRLSIASLTVLFPLALGLLLFLCGRTWLRRLRTTTRGGLALAASVLGVGCWLGLLVLVASRPDADDVGFIGPALTDAATPSAPFTVDPFRFPFHGRRVDVPFLSENEAYEAMVVTLARPLGLDPLSAYHNHFAFIATVMWAVTYALLFRRFRLPPGSVWLAVLLAATFLMFDGNLHRSLGNFSLLRIWQGKVVAWAVLGPAFLWLTLRALARPDWVRYLLVLTLGCVGFVVNRSTMMLFSVIGIAAVLARLLGYGWPPRRRLRTLAPVLLVAPLLVLGATLALLALPDEQTPQSLASEILRTQVAGGTGEVKQVQRYGATWSRSLYDLVLGSSAVILRDAAFLIVLPLLVVPRPLRRFLPLYAAAIALLALSPLSGPVWHHFVTNAYWRLYHALPLPLCAGLAVGLAIDPRRRSRPVNRALMAVVLVVLVGIALERPALSAANGVVFKHPLEYRLPPIPLEYTRSIAPQLRGKLVMAPSEIATVLALTEVGTVDLVFSRVANRGNPKSRANALMNTCRANRKGVDAFEALLSVGVDAVVLASCTPEGLENLRKRMHRYRLAEASATTVEAYRLFWVHEKR